MKKLTITNVILILCFQSTSTLFAQRPPLPLIGAQVFIEPGQTNQDIEKWFQILHDAGMKVCRIRMFEIYMHYPDGSWDYSLYDQAFRMAEKYDVKIFATLFPQDSKNSVGGEKFPESEEHLTGIASYIEHIVKHFRDYKSLYGWVLQNEPGTGGSLPENEFTQKAFTRWKEEQQKPVYNSRGYKMETFEAKRFLLDYETWFLRWIADEVKKYDPGRYIHVNNHQIFENVAEYDFPAWRNFLTSLGASAHPSWHFGYFSRDQYTLALSANCDIIRSGAGELPFWITELQGGNNIYSGNIPMCPTREEITQWIWTAIAGNAKGIIFWCLNPRASADEAGEWAMITFQNEPSDRLVAASEVIKTISRYPRFFSTATYTGSEIHILYTRESLWAETRSQMKGEKTEGRSSGGVMKSALACYEALAEYGITGHFSEIREFEWGKQDYKNYTIILAHQIALPSTTWEKLEDFVSSGGKLIVTGLTGFFDENMHNVMKTGFPLEKLFGGNIREFRHVSDLFHLETRNPPYTFPVHLQKGIIKNSSAQVIGQEGEDITATRNHFGKGEVVWIPSMIELGARKSDNHALSGFLKTETSASCASVPVSFVNQEKGMLLKTMKSGEDYVSVFINKTQSVRNIMLKVPERYKPEIIFSDKSGKITDRNLLTIHPEETMVVHWSRML